MGFEVGQRFEMFGKSNRGNSRIGQHGKIWKIIKMQRNVAFDTRNGDWALLRSEATQYERWCLMNQDNDFGIDKVL